MSEEDDRAKEQLRNADGRPLIMVSHDRGFCPLHGEPYRAAYPKGYAEALGGGWEYDSNGDGPFCDACVECYRPIDGHMPECSWHRPTSDIGGRVCNSDCAEILALADDA